MRRPEIRIPESLEAKPKARRALLAVGLALGLLLLGLAGNPGAPFTSLGNVARYGWRQVVGAALGPVRVGIQVGHLDAADDPQELAALRVSTGAEVAGLREVDVNEAVARALAGLLEAKGVRVDLIPSTPPPGYHADLFLALHADSNADSSRRGYKSAFFHPQRNRFDPLLKADIDRAYLSLSGLPSDAVNVSGDMDYYYAFNFRRYRHSVSPATPGLIVELGYLSNPSDRTFLRHPKRVAAALARGILTYLEARGRLPAR